MPRSRFSQRSQFQLNLSVVSNQLWTWVSIQTASPVASLWTPAHRLCQVDPLLQFRMQLPPLRPRASLLKIKSNHELLRSSLGQQWQQLATKRGRPSQTPPRRVSSNRLRINKKKTGNAINNEEYLSICGECTQVDVFYNRRGKCNHPYYSTTYSSII